MAPMDESELEKLRTAVAEGTVEGNRAWDDEQSAPHAILPTPASKVGKLFWGVLASLLTAAIVGFVGFLIWYGAQGAVLESQTKELKRHDDFLIRLDADKASRVQVQEQIKVWSDAQRSMLDRVEQANTQQHQAIDGKLDKLLFEMRRGR